MRGRRKNRKVLFVGRQAKDGPPPSAQTGTVTSSEAERPMGGQITPRYCGVGGGALQGSCYTEQDCRHASKNTHKLANTGTSAISDRWEESP